MAEGRVRLHAVDHIKAAAIIAVVFTHAGRGWTGPGPGSLDFLLSSLWVRFHVPSFLFCSGLLYATREPVPLRTVGARLVRVLQPYLVASCAAHLAGVTRAGSFSDVAFQLFTASSLGVYYYIFLIVALIPLVWPLSRVSRAAVAALAVAVLAHTLVLLRQPEWALSGSIFWGVRDPLRHFVVGYFVVGWWCGLSLPLLARLAERHRPALTVLCAAVALVCLAAFSKWFRVEPNLARIAYTFSVVGLLGLWTRHRPPGSAVRFLSEATLGLYLYHRIFQIWVMPIANPLPDGPRIALLVAVGLGGAVAVMWAGRRWLGPDRARRWLGA